ncbi:Glycosyl transferase [Macleaya cordata]|uniref:Hexosyltransferase n=1 Tax=Macleaya cordata TaxID=56857 RepID=A0A200R2K2_MACCD|nr:Glycosyl transferase [Macleaya cordata]
MLIDRPKLIRYHEKLRWGEDRFLGIMRRRAAEFRRPVRRRFSYWIWGLLGLFSVAALVMFVVHHNHEDRIEQPIRVKSDEQFHHEGLNFTEEILSVTSFARQLSDQMTLAKAYVIIAKEHNNLQLAWELSSKIRNCQLLLSKAAMRGKPITLDEAQPLVKGISSLIYKAQDAHYDIATTIITMKSHIQAIEERANAATVQSTAFGQLAAEMLPKNLHCLNIKLTADWHRKPILREVAAEKKNSPRLVDNNLYHFCIFSDNLLATSAVVNSTVSNADHPKQLVFHIVTDGISYGAMQTWFLGNDFKGSTIEIQNIEEFSWLNASYSPVVKQLLDEEVRAYYFGTSQDPKGETKFRNPKYLSLLNHLRFYIPEIYPLLEKVVFLDDDIVVQKDLTPLFSLDLHGNVNGAVETCLEAFHRYYKYLNFSNPVISSKFDPQACGWAFGLNVFDLIAWKKANVTQRYHYWQEQNGDRTLWKLGTLPPGLLTFYGLTEPLDRRWHVLGLGFDMNIDNRLIESAAVIHFNGNMKPWLKLAIGRYKPLWERYVNHTHPYIQNCITR